MTRKHTRFETDTRRSFLKKGALTSGALAFGLGSVGSAAAQQGDETTGQTDQAEALMFNDEFHAGAQFRVISAAIQRTPEFDGVQVNELPSAYNTRIIEYANTREEAYFFPAHERLGQGVFPASTAVEEGEVYEMSTEITQVIGGDGDRGDLIRVSYQSVSEDERLITQDDNQLDPGEDFEVVGGGGKALVRGRNFSPGGLVRITSGVVEWTPRSDVQGSDIASEYNTRHAEYLNTSDEFLVYPAHGAEIEEGAVYVLRDEFDITDPEGFLVTADLARVNESDLDDGLLE